MLLKLFLAFTIIPVVELYLLIKIGSIIGAIPTILIVIGTGFLGAYLARVQGLKTMWKVRDNLSQGIMPAEELLDALLIVVAGVVLLTPGFLTDFLGFSLLIPASRNLIKRWLRKQLERLYFQGNIIEHPKT